MGKPKHSKKIIRLANEMARLENLIQDGVDIEENTAKINQLCLHLSLQDLEEIDDRIIAKHKINKKEK